LAGLEARAAALSRQYRGQIVKLTDAAAAAEAAAAQALLLRRRLASARQQIARLAAASYMGGGMDPTLTLLADADPQRVLDRAATIEYLSRQRSTRAQQLQQLAVAGNRAELDAQAKVAELRRLIATL